MLVIFFNFFRTKIQKEVSTVWPAFRGFLSDYIICNILRFITEIFAFSSPLLLKYVIYTQIMLHIFCFINYFSTILIKIPVKFTAINYCSLMVDKVSLSLLVASSVIELQYIAVHWGLESLSLLESSLNSTALKMLPVGRNKGQV